MKHLNTLIRIVTLMTCFICGFAKADLQSQICDIRLFSLENKLSQNQTDSSQADTTDNTGAHQHLPAPDSTSERIGVFEIPELVVPTDTPTELSTEMRHAAEFYTDLMWAVYCGTDSTDERNIRKSRDAYDALINESLEASNDFVTLSFIYTERARLRFNTLQNFKGAEDDVRKAIELDPKNVSATWLLAQMVYSSLLENRRDAHTQALQEEMLDVLKRVIELDPDHEQAHRYLGPLARGFGQIELAITSFKALTRIMPFDDRYHRELGELYEMQNRLEEALLSYERVVTILPEHISYRNHLGQLYLQTGDFPAAIKTFLAVLTQLETHAGTPAGPRVHRTQRDPRASFEVSETEIEAHHGISLAYQAQDNFEKAEFHIQRALGLLEKQAASIRDGTRRVRSADRITLTLYLQEMRYTLGQIYLRFNVPRKAVTAFTQILETDATHVPALSGLGMAYQMLEDLKRAETYLRRAIELSSKNELPDTYNALGYLYAEQGIKLDEAAALVQRALKSAPTSGAYLDSLGFIYFKQGKLDSAIENLELAIRYLPDTPIILLHLADAYLQKGLKEKAVQALEQAVHLEPENAEFRQKLNALKTE